MKTKKTASASASLKRIAEGIKNGEYYVDATQAYRAKGYSEMHFDYSALRKLIKRELPLHEPVRIKLGKVHHASKLADASGKTVSVIFKGSTRNGRARLFVKVYES